MVAVGDCGLRRKAQRAPQQAIAHCGRQELVGADWQRLMAAGAGEEEHAELLRTLVETGKCRKLPRRRECAPVGRGKRQRIAPPRLQLTSMEMPMLAAGVAHAPAHVEIADA